LDANGEATVEVPLNDSLTAFRVVAVADAGVQTFGTGRATLRVTQDLQLLSGLPPLVREGDRFEAMLTLRNTTTRAMTVRATLKGRPSAGAALELPAQQVKLEPGSATELVWPVEVPAQASAITWEAGADELGREAGAARDRLRKTQVVVPAVPVRTQQATMAALEAPLAWPVQPPAGALTDAGVPRSGLLVSVQPRLKGALPGVRRWFEAYPYTCLEQRASRAIGMQDAAQWAAAMQTLPVHLDSDGLASHFPPGPQDAARGSDRLTAYLLAASQASGLALPAPLRERMLGGLVAFVEGRIERRHWSPRPDLDVRKLAALEALARHGRAQPRMLGSLTLAPAQWPTSALIDWLSILRQVETVPDRARRLEEAQQLLRARLAYSGTTLRFANEAGDHWWWLMEGADANAARLILAVLDDPAWRGELPRLVTGHLQRQQRGAWSTTIANAWSVVALERFGERFESAPVRGRTAAAVSAAVGSVGGAATSAPAVGPPQSLDWARTPEGGALNLPWPPAAGTLRVTHEGSGRPWVTVQARAAVPVTQPVSAGFTLTRTLVPVSQRESGRWSRGDVVRVRVELQAAADMNWVVLADPVPAGATVLGSGLGRDSAVATAGESTEGAGRALVAFDERGFESFRRYFEFLPRGRHVVEYTVRLNQPGRFGLPASRVEAMYAPEVFGEVPVAPLEVGR
ncbi:MAG: alpha-2-macroglobulin family protein, partial [Rubrivivax sp.]